MAPTDVPNLHTWYRADSIAQADNTAVTSWTDSSGGGFTMSQVNALKQPTLQTAEINGLPIVRFDGTADGLASSAPGNGVNQTVIAVARASNVTGIRTIRGGQLQVTCNGGIPTAYSNSVNLLGASTGGSIGTTNFVILTFTFNDTTGAWAWFRNGTADGSGTNTTVSLTGTALQAISGSDSTVSQEYWQGDIAEVISYTRVITAGERSNVHSYLQEKYGITVSDYVPTSVPKNAADSATRTETFSVTARSTANDSGIQTDTASVAVKVSGADSGIGTNTASVGVVVPVDAGDVTVEGLPITVHHVVNLGVGDITVDGPAPNLAHHAPLDIGDVTVDGLPVEFLGRLDLGEVEVQGLPIQVSYGSTGPGGQGGVVAVPPAVPSRFLVQSILDGRFLSWDLELSDPQVALVLSGPTSITGVLKPEDPETRKLLLGGGFEPWACWIHHEIEGEIRASGILQPYQIDGETLSVEAAGVSAYAHGIPWLAELSAIQIDPANVVRAIWAHLQSYPDGQLGVTVTGTTPVRIGTPAMTVPKTDPETGAPVLDDNGNQILEDVEAKPYELMFWEGTDCGSEIDSLAGEAPFDYIERCAWNDARTTVTHWIEIGYPRIGQRCIGAGAPRFASGENILNAVPAEETDDLYASQVVVFGKGEGRDTTKGYAGRPLNRRLRRVAIVQDKTIPTPERATAAAGSELERRQALIDVTDLEVDARHPNAVFGSYQVGDDVLVDVEVDWIGRLRQYERILSITYAPDLESVRLELRRSEAFRYGEGA